MQSFSRNLRRHLFQFYNYDNHFFLNCIGNVESALYMTNELLQIHPEHERAHGNKVYYEKEIAQLIVKKKNKGDTGTEDTPISDLVALMCALSLSL